MIRRCPTCRNEAAWEGNPDKPFCSERCRMIDLGRWANEDYRVPTQEYAAVPTTGEGSEGSEDDEPK